MELNKAKHIYRQINHIDGWFNEEAACLFAFLDNIQKENKIKGNLFEIGVHHGKSASFIAHMLDEGNEKFEVCDIFDNQVENISSSGKGNYEIFIKNIGSFIDDANLVVHKVSSFELVKLKIGSDFRFIHIDGGHSRDECLNDLLFASTHTKDSGIIAVDDAFKPAWPAIAEAIIDFLRGQNNGFVPLIIGFNKMIFVKSNYFDFYRSYFDSEFFIRFMNRFMNYNKYVLKEDRICGATILKILEQKHKKKNKNFRGIISHLYSKILS